MTSLTRSLRISMVPPETVPTRPETNGRLLIADDESTFARPLAELFRREGFAAEAVADGTAARRALTTCDFDALIADINMPGNAALELVADLTTTAPAVPVILLTGSPTIETAAHAVQLRAIAYLLKPVEFDELLPLVRKAVSQSRTKRQLQSRREQLQQQLDELKALETMLEQPGATTDSAAGDFVRLSVNNVMSAVMEFRRVTELVTAAQHNANSVWQANTVHALERSIEVLERTRRNFKSTELRDLRHELQNLVAQFRGGTGNP